MKLDYISTLDKRTKEGKRVAQATKMAGKLLILVIALFYVVRSIIIAHAAGIESSSVAVPTHLPICESQPVPTTLEPSNVPVSVTPDPTKAPAVKPKVIQAEKQNSPTKKGIYRFVRAYNSSRIDKKYVDTLFAKCGNDIQAVSRVVGIALAETGLGRDTKKTTNFYGWFANGDRNYDPKIEEMATVMCKAVKGTYRYIGVNANVTATYTGNDGVSAWTKRYNWAMARMTIE